MDSLSNYFPTTRSLKNAVQFSFRFFFPDEERDKTNFARQRQARHLRPDPLGFTGAAT
jgi:hypothetical protein